MIKQYFKKSFENDPFIYVFYKAPPWQRIFSMATLSIPSIFFFVFFLDLTTGTELIDELFFQGYRIIITGLAALFCCAWFLFKFSEGLEIKNGNQNKPMRIPQDRSYETHKKLIGALWVLLIIVGMLFFIEGIFHYIGQGLSCHFWDCIKKTFSFDASQ